jgi:hypothetical protein
VSGEGGSREISGVIVTLYPRPLRFATTPALRGRCCTLRWEAGPRDWYQAFPFLTIEAEARLQHDAAPRHAQSSLKELGKDSITSRREALNSRSAFEGDGGKVQGKGMVWGAQLIPVPCLVA